MMSVNGYISWDSLRSFKEKETDNMKFSVAIQVYSVRDDAEKDLNGTLKKIKEMGYDGVELAGLYGYSYEEVKEAVEKAWA